MLPGTLAGTSNDRLFLIGAHYDSVRTTSHGANDNGSGVAAMLQVAKQMATGILKKGNPCPQFLLDSMPWAAGSCTPWSATVDFSCKLTWVILVQNSVLLYMHNIPNQTNSMISYLISPLPPHLVCDRTLGVFLIHLLQSGSRMCMTQLALILETAMRSYRFVLGRGS